MDAIREIRTVIDSKVIINLPKDYSECHSESYSECHIEHHSECYSEDLLHLLHLFLISY